MSLTPWQIRLRQAIHARASGGAMVNPMDPIAVGGLVVGAIRAVAAIAAAYYAKNSPIKEDLARVENHLAEQTRRESLACRADRRSISVHGDAALGESLELLFIFEDLGAILLRADLINNANTLTASVECDQQTPQHIQGHGRIRLRLPMVRIRRSHWR